MTARQVAIQPTTSEITLTNHWDHLLARWGVNRSAHRVDPGLYALGSPGPDAPVFVTANYTLSFDALRSSLGSVDGYIVVLDTKGINVWCAAGKGTFGTDEIVHRVEATGLHDVVDHRVLILPQLGAPGVSAHEVKKRTGFRVEYGPVRAADLPAYLETRQATPEMRRVRFGFLDRLVLVPVELVHVLLPTLVAAAILLFVGGWLASAGAIAAVLAGAALFPMLLPWIPTHAFSSKGFILGAAVAVPFAAITFVTAADAVWWQRIGRTLAYLLAMPPVTAFLALNFTGSSTYTSKTGVRREMFAYIPAMAWTFGIGIVLTLVSFLIRV